MTDLALQRNLDGKVAIVAGAGGLLGPEFGAALAELGASLVLIDLCQEDVNQIARDLSSRYDVPTMGVKTDITEPSSVASMAEQVIQRFKRIDILVNGAAGRSQNFFAPFEEYSLEDWQAVMDVNLTGTFLCCQAVGRYMKKQRSGSIVNMASIYGISAPDQRIYSDSSINTPAVYSASKAGVIGLTKYLAAYWAPSGIRVNAITPGGVINNQEESFVKNYASRTPLGRMAFPGELRGAIAFLASDLSSYVTGHNLVVDGGWTSW